ncbi:diacylglycerol kinase family protein [Flavobacterium sp. NG2]|uniref:diacylglycerol/lipid kinase family protein n=1 Tax=Flavobacterium sp. NG2 TaxID=3097547 RepID=UPI002A80D755|nr:diacylglycerol kinase family protein [Flavobacterium sp. NG2]WPR71751.1 diacylglycerol kinase family protein [Flavobacterium sp. NG2]
MKKNILLVVNPVSGGLEKTDYIQAVNDFVATKEINLVLYYTTDIDDILKIRELYDEYKPERIIIAGGDGTIKLVGDAVAHKDVVLGILPVGSANGLAVELDLIRTIEENLEIALFNDYLEIDMVVINHKKSLHLSDIGLNAELIKNYKKSKIHGKWGYFAQAFRTLVNAPKPFHVIIETARTTIDTEARMIVIANAQKYGTGVVINPLGTLNDGKFELVILKKINLGVISNIVMGRMPLGHKDIEIISTDSATIKTNIPVGFQIDGEYVGNENELTISISSDKIKVAIP